MRLFIFIQFVLSLACKELMLHFSASDNFLSLQNSGKVNISSKMATEKNPIDYEKFLYLNEYFVFVL